MAVTTGTGASLTSAPVVFSSDGEVDAVQPVLQAQDGSFIGTVQIGWDNGPLNAMADFDQSGNIRWTVPGNYQPQIATADGGLIATDPSGAAYTFDQYGNATGVLSGSPTQSWFGNAYPQLGLVEQVVAQPVDVDGASFWPQAGGNPSENGTAIVRCPCLLQSTSGTLTESLFPKPGLPAEAERFAHPQATAQIQSAPPPPPAYVLLVGDPGLDGWNQKDSFNVAAQTQANALLGQGSLPITQRVSSIEDFNSGLTQNGYIDGGVFYFGHGGAVPVAPGVRMWGLAPGEQSSPDTNITALNVNTLSNAQLGPHAVIVLNACNAAAGGPNSIAYLISRKLQAVVYAPVLGMFFSIDPNSKAASGKDLPDPPDHPPVYMIQQFGNPLTRICPWGQCQ
jgi:hypothetical protein